MKLPRFFPRRFPRLPFTLPRLTLDQVSSAMLVISLTVLVSLSGLALTVSLLNGQAQRRTLENQDITLDLLRKNQMAHQREEELRNQRTLDTAERIETFIHNELTDQIDRLLANIRTLRFTVETQTEGGTTTIIISPRPAPRPEPSPTPTKPGRRNNKEDR